MKIIKFAYSCCVYFLSYLSYVGFLPSLIILIAIQFLLLNLFFS